MNPGDPATRIASEAGAVGNDPESRLEICSCSRTEPSASTMAITNPVNDSLDGLRPSMAMVAVPWTFKLDGEKAPAVASVIWIVIVAPVSKREVVPSDAGVKRLPIPVHVKVPTTFDGSIVGVDGSVGGGSVGIGVPFGGVVPVPGA